MQFHFYLVHNPVCFELNFFNKQSVLQLIQYSNKHFIVRQVIY